MANRPRLPALLACDILPSRSIKLTVTEGCSGVFGKSSKNPQKNIKDAMPQDTNEIYELGPFRISVGERVLRREDRIVPLTPKCFDTLLVLAQHAGNVVEKERLMRVVWPDSFVEESNLSQNIFVLRKTLGETPEGAKYIQTIPKRGYRLVVPAAEAGPAVSLPGGAASPPASE